MQTKDKPVRITQNQYNPVQNDTGNASMLCGFPQLMWFQGSVKRGHKKSQFFFSLSAAKDFESKLQSNGLSWHACLNSNEYRVTQLMSLWIRQR